MFVETCLLPQDDSQVPERDDVAVTTLDAKTQLAVCIAENRRNCEPALRILIASLAQHCPGLSICLYCPDASPDFASWVAGFPQVSVHTLPPGSIWTKYDIKPVVLLDLLEKGYENLLWVDSDILVCDDFRALLSDLPPDVIAVSEEALCSSHADPDGLRARLWGMEVGRSLPFCLNSGIVRVTSRHADLLRNWRALLESKEYRAAQERPWHERGPHLLGDQEVLTALLSSAAYAHFPLYLLRRGQHIIQYFGASGYTVAERLHHLRAGNPAFVHSQGYRPWWPRTAARGMRECWLQLYNDLSPYTFLARRHAAALEDRAWLSPPTVASRLFRALAIGKAPLAGLPLALVSDCIRWVKRWARRSSQA